MTQGVTLTLFARILGSKGSDRGAPGPGAVGSLSCWVAGCGLQHPGCDFCSWLPVEITVTVFFLVMSCPGLRSLLPERSCFPRTLSGPKRCLWHRWVKGFSVPSWAMGTEQTSSDSSRVTVVGTHQTAWFLSCQNKFPYWVSELIESVDLTGA